MPWLWHRFPNPWRRNRTSPKDPSGSIAKFDGFDVEIEIALIMTWGNGSAIPQNTEKIRIDNASYDATATVNTVRRKWIIRHLLDISSIEGENSKVVLQWSFPGVSIAYQTAHVVLDDDGPPVVFFPNRNSDIPSIDLSAFQQGLQRYYQDAEEKRTRLSKHGRSQSWVVRPSRVFTWPLLQPRRHRGASISSVSNYQGANLQATPDCTNTKNIAEEGESWENIPATIICPGVQIESNGLVGQGNATGAVEAGQCSAALYYTCGMPESGLSLIRVEEPNNADSGGIEAPRIIEIEPPVHFTEEQASLAGEEPVRMTWNMAACIVASGNVQTSSQEPSSPCFVGSCSALDADSTTSGFCRSVVSQSTASDAKTMTTSPSETTLHDRTLQSASPDLVARAHATAETTTSSCHSPSSESTFDFQSRRDSTNTGASSVSNSQVVRNPLLPPVTTSHGVEDCHQRPNTWAGNQLPGLGPNLSPLYENIEASDDETINPDNFWTYDERENNYYHIDVEEDGTRKTIWYPEEFL